MRHSQNCCDWRARVSCNAFARWHESANEGVIAAQDPKDPDVLVLSGRTGAAYKMTDPLLVNPCDTQNIVRAKKRALEMPRVKRRVSYERLLGELREHDIHNCSRSFTAALRAAGERRYSPPANGPTQIFVAPAAQPRRLNG